MKRDSNTTATGTRLSYPVEISDTKTGSKYVAAYETECEDETDKSAYREALHSGEVITMGSIIARPLPCLATPRPCRESHSSANLNVAGAELLEAAKEFVTRMDEVKRGLREWTTLFHAEELTLAAIKLVEEHGYELRPLRTHGHASYEVLSNMAQWEEGAAASAGGMAESFNPYKMGSVEFEAWKIGWMEAEEIA